MSLINISLEAFFEGREQIFFTGKVCEREKEARVNQGKWAFFSPQNKPGSSSKLNQRIGREGVDHWQPLTRGSPRNLDLDILARLGCRLRSKDKAVI